MDIRLERSEIFARLERSALKHRKIEAPDNAQRFEIGKGTAVSSNESGRLVYAEYATGVRVRRNKTSVLVQSADGTYWFGDCKGCWFRLD